MHDIRQYQIVQTARNELTFVYALQNKSVDIKQELIRTLNEALAQKGLENHITIHLKEVKSISRDERSGKYKYVISLGEPSGLNKA
jgi:hypothetical protein